jgi:2-hydroxychromene-2-carboxylate isomerase
MPVTGFETSVAARFEAHRCDGASAGRRRFFCDRAVARFWRDMERQCRKYGLRWRQPSAFPRVGVLPSRVALLGAEQPWIGAFCRRVMELNFVLDQDINQADRLAPILTELDLAAGKILDQAQAEPTKKRLWEQTEEARCRGIFGAPTFFVGAEMFWGNDRLDDALLFASGQIVESSLSQARR